MSDQNNVEIKIIGTLDPSVSSSARAASAEIDKLGQTTRVSAKTMSDALKAAGGDLSKITPEMAGLATATASVAPAATSTAAAITQLGRAHTNTRAATESLVIVHEALQGRLTRIPGSMMILAQAATGASTGLLYMGAAVVGVVAGLAYLVVKSLEAANALEKVALAGLGTQGFAATETQIKQLSDQLSVLPQVSSATAQQVVATFQTMQNRSQASLQGLSAATEAWAELTGQKTEKAAEELAKVFGDPFSATSRSFITNLRGVTAAQIDNFDSAKEAGDIYGAQRAILEALSGTIDQNKLKLEQHSASIHTSWRNFAQYIAAIEGGMTSQEVESGMLDDEAKKWDKLTASIHGATAALATEQQSPQQKLSRAVLDADTVDTTRVRIADLKAKVTEFTDELSNPDATDKMKANFRSSIAAATAEITQLQNKQQFRGTGFSNAGAEQIAQARETISEINSDQTKGDAERQADIQKTYQDILSSSKLNAAQRLQVEKAMNDAITAENKRTATEKRQIDQNDVQTSLELSKLGTEQQRRDLEAEVADGLITKQQELSQLIPILEAERDAKLKAITEAQQGYAQDSTFFLEKENEKKIAVAQSETDIANIRRQIEQQSAKERVALEKQAAAEQLASDKAMYSQLASAEGTFVSDMFAGRVGLYGSLAALGRQFVEKEITDDLKYFTAHALLSQAELEKDKSLGQAGIIFNALFEGEKTSATAAGTATRGAVQTSAAATENAGFLARAAKWIASELGMTTATTTAETTRVAAQTAAAATAKAEEAAANYASAESYAGVAAAAAAAAVAGIPIVGPELAVAAAATTFAALQPYAAMAALDVGAYDVPKDMPAYIHQGEMVVPKTFATGLRQSFAGGPNVFGGNTNNTTTGGDTFHIAVHSHGQSASSSARDMVDAINHQRRIGRLKKN